MMKVEFIYHRECPHVEGARANLLHALSEARVPMRWTEWDRPSPETPQYAREYGSPTILVNGRDIEGWTPSGEVTTCRIYGHQGVPSVELIRSALLRKTAEQKSSWYQNIATLTGISVALLPKVACPACWPVYASVVSFLGLGFLLSAKYLLLTTVVFLFLAAGSLGVHAWARRGFGPFLLGASAGVAVLLGKFVYESSWVTYAGFSLLVIASIWNAWPRQKSCACLASSSESVFEKGENSMNRKIEVFSAGCPVCQNTIELVNRIACPSCEVEVLDMRKSDVAARAKQYGVKTVPAVVVDGKLADCCKREGPDEGSLRSAGLGVPA